MPTTKSPVTKPVFTFINNSSGEGDRLSSQNRLVVRKHCRNRWRLEKEEARRVKPEIRIINFGRQPKSSADVYSDQSGSSTPTSSVARSKLNKLSSPWSDGVFSSCNPFDTLPLPENHWSNVSMQYYLTRSRPLVPLDKASVRQDLFLQRRDVWMPMAIRDEAAFCAFVAWVQTDPRCPAHLRDDEFAQRCHETALRLTKERLSRAADGKLDDATVFAIGMLNFVAWNMTDPAAMAAHYHGFINVLAYRNGLVIDHTGYAKSSQQRAHARETKGYELGFKELFEFGLLPVDIAHPFRYFIGRSELTTLMERDQIAAAFMMNHIDPIPCDLGSILSAEDGDEPTVLFNACHSTIHVAGYLMYDEPCNVEGDDLRLGLEDTIAYTHKATFCHDWRHRFDILWQRYPLVLLWISLINGAATRHVSRRNDFKWLLKSTIEVTNLWNFGMAVDQLSTYFTWPGALDNRVHAFWMESITFDLDAEALSFVRAGKDQRVSAAAATALRSSNPGSPGSSSSTNSARASMDSASSADKFGELPLHPDAKIWKPQEQKPGERLMANGCLFMAMKRTLGPSGAGRDVSSPQLVSF